MKKITSMLLAGAMMLALAACGGGGNTSTPSTSTPAASTPSTTTTTPAASTPAPAANTGADYSSLDPVTLIGGDSAGRGAAAQLLGELITSKLDEITDGQLTMDYHPNGDLGGDADMLRQVQAGDMDIIISQIAPAVSFIPDLAVFDLPLVFASYDGATISKVLNDSDSAFNEAISASYESAGYHLLGFLQNATYRLTTSNKELNTLADFKGLHIRTMENANHMAFWTAINAEPTPLAWAEVYFALQSGTIDAEENAADTVVGANLNEVQKYLACTNHILYCNQVCINKDVYEGLDPLYQDALNQAVSEAIAEMEPQLAKIDSDNKADLESKGMTIIEYPDSFYEEILALDAVQDLYSSIDATVNGLGTTLITSLENA